MAEFPLAHISFALADEETRLGWDAFVRDLFDPRVLYEVLTTPESERLGVNRHHTLFAIGDTVIYGSTPAGAGLLPDSTTGNMLRALAANDAWIGIALGVADLDAARAWVRERGWTPVSYPLLEDRYFLVDRNETLGMRLEFLTSGLANDPRVRADWDAAWWRDHHPLGFEGLQSIGVSTLSLDAAREVFGGKLGWREIGTRTTEEARCASFLMGDVIVEAMEPLRDDTELADHARQVNGIWCLTFKVRSASAAADFFRAKGLTLIGDPWRRFAIDPGQAFGRRLWFTDETPPGYPEGPLPSQMASPPTLDK
jgi:catechol 2,3-dioxygenase-like lactoylglutathione lyase family enzyme